MIHIDFTVSVCLSTWSPRVAGLFRDVGNRSIFDINWAWQVNSSLKSYITSFYWFNNQAILSQPDSLKFLFYTYLFLIIGYHVKMKGKHYYFMLTTASVVWFKVMTMILQNVIKNTPLHKSFHKSNFNQMINIWTPKEHITDDILSQIRRWQYIQHHLNRLEDLSKEEVKKIGDGKWKTTLKQPSPLFIMIHTTFRLLVIFSKYDLCLNFLLI